MNYETATDFQLNAQLAHCLGLEMFECQDAAIKSKSSSVLICDNSGGSKEFNYCTDISVVWPLMIKHGIELSPCYNGWWFAGVVESYTNEEEPLSYGGVTICEDPIRAIVICLIKVMSNKQ